MLVSNDVNTTKEFTKSFPKFNLNLCLNLNQIIFPILVLLGYGFDLGLLDRDLKQAVLTATLA